MTLIPPRTTIFVTMKAKPLLTPTNAQPPIVKVAAMLHFTPMECHTLPMIDPVIILALISSVIGAPHTFAIHVIFVNEPMSLNRWIVKCIIPPQVTKLPRALTCCIKLSILIDSYHTFFLRGSDHLSQDLYHVNKD